MLRKISVVFGLSALFNLSAFSCSEIQYSNDVKKVCRHHWKEKNKKKVTEVTFYSKGCEKLEGDPAEDCYFVKTCDSHFISGPIFKRTNWLNGLCKFKNPEVRVLLGSPDEVPPSSAKATAVCLKGSFSHIEIKTPGKKATQCFLE